MNRGLYTGTNGSGFSSGPGVSFFNSQIIPFGNGTITPDPNYGSIIFITLAGALTITPPPGQYSFGQKMTLIITQPLTGGPYGLVFEGAGSTTGNFFTNTYFFTSQNYTSGSELNTSPGSMIVFDFIFSPGPDNTGVWLQLSEFSDNAWPNFPTQVFNTAGSWSYYIPQDGINHVYNIQCQAGGGGGGGSGSSAGSGGASGGAGGGGAGGFSQYTLTIPSTTVNLDITVGAGGAGGAAGSSGGHDGTGGDAGGNSEVAGLPSSLEIIANGGGGGAPSAHTTTSNGFGGYGGGLGGGLVVFGSGGGGAGAVNSPGGDATDGGGGGGGGGNSGAGGWGSCSTTGASGGGGGASGGSGTIRGSGGGAGSIGTLGTPGVVGAGGGGGASAVAGTGCGGGGAGGGAASSNEAGTAGGGGGSGWVSIQVIG